MLQLSGQPLSLHEIATIADASVRIQIDPAAIAQMDASRDVVRRVAEDRLAVYGINTGFGKLCEVRIPDDELARLQLNLVRSHACGLAVPLSEPETRVIVALRANTLALGYSGVRPVVAQTLTHMLNSGVHPVIPSKGSVGASGDLAPLAHLALCVIGEGEAIYRGERMPGRTALERAGIDPVRLQAKEGLALLNGTKFGAGLESFAIAQGFGGPAEVAARSRAMNRHAAVHAPRGATLRCQGWHQEAALRMLHNNLDPEVAENPDELIVYGGTGRAARDWPSFHAIVRALESLANDETLLVQSGRPVGVFRTHPESPRVLLANSNLVGHWSNWDEFNRL